MELNGIKPNVHIPHFPVYDTVRVFLSLIEGTTRRTLLNMRQTLLEYRGTPKDSRDWSNPSVWIPQMLYADERELAQRLWSQSGGELNPRHLLGIWLLCSSYELLEPDRADVLRITSRGHDFLENEAGDAVQFIDYSEGLLALLAIVAERGPGRRADLLPHFAEFLMTYSRRQAPSVMNSTWQGRIVNLVERGLIRRDGLIYTIERKGLAYLELAETGVRLGTVSMQMPRALNELLRLLKEQSSQVRADLLQALRTMNPYRLEHVVKDLLEAIGYQNIEVTRPSNDKGVDVVGDINIGISAVREVVQVKRQVGNVQRPALDEFRGSLHRFNALRGTIITTSDFSSGVKQAAYEPGVAPITLINGERLADLLIEHEIGVRRDTLTVLKFQAEYFDPEFPAGDDSE